MPVSSLSYYFHSLNFVLSYDFWLLNYLIYILYLSIDIFSLILKSSLSILGFFFHRNSFIFYIQSKLLSHSGIYNWVMIFVAKYAKYSIETFQTHLSLSWLLHFPIYSQSLILSTFLLLWDLLLYNQKYIYSSNLVLFHSKFF